MKTDLTEDSAKTISKTIYCTMQQQKYFLTALTSEPQKRKHSTARK